MSLFIAPCIEHEHVEYATNLICMESECNKISKVICVMCERLNHKNHKTIPVAELIKKIHSSCSQNEIE
jgi:hypothetical protein